MHRILLIIVFLIGTLFGKESLKDEKIEILAEKLDIKEDIVNATGDVVVYSINYYITADRLRYDKKNGKLELFDNVSIIKNNQQVSYSEYVFIDINKDINNFKPVLVLDNSKRLWFNAKDGLKDNDTYKLKDSTLSSCDCIDPVWNIGFSSGDHNTTKQWMNTYNTTLYIKGVPVFYTPYFGFPTDDTRRTGILPPTIGYSGSEGFIYAQPLYYAPQLNYDFEYIPQIRTNRGEGHTLKYRYVDSAYSKLNFEIGVFNEKSSYQEENKLTNDKHYGWEFDYKRSKLFSTDDDTDGLIIHAVDMNDVDYINTQYDSNITDDTDEYLKSYIKYFYNTNKYYGDIEINTYNDLTEDNNDEILQEIPSVTFHKYAQSFFDDYFTTSFDINTSRETIVDGVGGKTTELYIPINYHTYLFNDFLNFSFTEEINYTNIRYSGSDYDDANFGENNHVFSLYSDLVKPYDNFIHSMRLSTTYTDNNVFRNSGDIYDSDDDSLDDLSSFEINKTTKNISLELNQSFYSQKTLQEIVNHKISLSFIYNNDSNSFEKNTLENDIRLNYNYGHLSNKMIYNYLINGITSSSSTFAFRKDNYFANLSYSYLKDEDSLDVDETFSYDLGFSFGKYYRLSYGEEYDLENHANEERELIFNIDDKCWAIDIKFADSLVASDTTSSDDAQRQKIFYVTLTLKELFAIEQSFKSETN